MSIPKPDCIRYRTFRTLYSLQVVQKNQPDLTEPEPEPEPERYTAYGLNLLWFCFLDQGLRLDTIFINTIRGRERYNSVKLFLSES